MDDQTILASDDNFGNVTICPGGVVHVNLVHISLKFVPEDFVKFSKLVGKASANLDKKPPQRGKPRLQVVSSEPPACEPVDQE